MRHYHYILIFALLFASCAPKRIVTTSEKTDSVRIVKETEIIERWRDSIVYVSVPTEVKEAIRRDSSFLETSFAESEAKIMSDGSLFHSLANKPQEIEKEVQIKDTEHKETEKEIVIQKERIEVPVPYPLSRWQKFLLWSGAVAWGLAIGYTLSKIIRRH